MSLSISRAPPHLVKISMLKDVETQIAAVESDRPKSSLRGGARLWAQFGSATNSCRDGNPKSIAAIFT